MTPFSTRNRRGSALLIVLGFLSFMVVSAIAFAVFMRAERAPSSALRRGVATRHLVKAALARAMSDVDDAIRNDYFPGLAGSGMSDRARYYRDYNGNPINIWYGRVFMPPDTEGSTERKGTEPVINLDVEPNPTRFAPVSETVSTLCLEALGYLPAPLVNDVRFLSRCSWAAKWQNFPYDSGRYAYTAVNVSDYFDINLLYANRGRSSQDGGRITLASVFKDSSGKKIETTAASAFDTFVHETRVSSEGVSAKAPYVSMLDFNLALGATYSDGGLGGCYNSPFWSWINNSADTFYKDLSLPKDAKQMPGVASACRQTFVTDSWFPVSVTASGTSNTNLLYEEGQPFPKSTMDNSANIRIAEVIGKTHGQFVQVMQHEQNYLKYLDWAMLYDYLDRDDLPLSVNIPCVERVPMTAALEPVLTHQFKAKVSKLTATDPATPVEGQGYKQITTYSAKFDASCFKPQAALNAVIAFPFKRGKDLNSGNFKAQAMLRLFFVASQPGGGVVQLRNGGDLANLRPRKTDWDNPEQFSMNGNKAAVVTYVSGWKSLSAPSSGAQDEEEAFMDNGQTLFSDLQIKGSVDGTFFTKTETVQMSSSGQPQGSPRVAWAFPDGVRPFMVQNGQTVMLPDIPEGAPGGDLYDGLEIRPYLAMWVRIESDKGLVDLVPAYPEDDREYGGVDNSGELGQLEDMIYVGAGKGTPLLRVMDKSTPVALGAIIANAQPGDTDFLGNQAEWEPKSFFTVDPRYNWAPEDWLPRSVSASRQTWMDSLDRVLGQDGRDPDIFMAVSNQGYLQSMGEIAMLPRLSDENGNPIPAEYDGAVRTVDDQTGFQKIAHAAHAWRTYPADYELAEGERKTDGLYNLGIAEDGNGFRVNPYTDSLQVMKTALELTPYDWWAAGTNTVAKGDDNTTSASLKTKILKSVSEAVKYAYCEECNEAKLAQEDVDWLATFLMTSFRAGIELNPAKNWKEVFDSLPWYEPDPDKQDTLFGHKLQNNVVLHNVDRKYLYSYWRGCFANKQQLFLLFVRAESNALGGPGEGTPSQKGGRAVALVWRDPNLETTVQDYKEDRERFDGVRHPHRMRVLFYHQFE